MQDTISVSARTVRIAAAAAVIAAVAVVALGWMGGQARAAHDPSGATLHACAAPNGGMRLGEDCRANETAHVLATEAGLQAAEDRIAALEGTVAAQQATISGLEDDIAALQTLLAGVTRADDAFGRDTLRLTGMNLQLLNGTDSTDGVPNGLGNLIIGYNAPSPLGTAAADRAGSHYLVVGDQHHWTHFGGLLAGIRNTASGDFASVTGGALNTASGPMASVSGGRGNTASGHQASILGGDKNTVDAPAACHPGC